MSTFDNSTITAVPLAIYTGLKTRAALSDGVSICDGPADPTLNNREDVIEILDAEVDWTALMDRTTQPREESGKVEVVISCQRTTRRDQENVNARALALLQELQSMLREDPTLSAFYVGNAQLAWTRIGRIKHTKRTDPTNTRREAGLIVTVIWKARLRTT